MPENGTPVILTPQEVHRLAITRQRLAGERPTPDIDGLMAVMRDIRCLQLDPIDTVARSPLLVLWSRLGNYDPELLARALWQERHLFEYMAHVASIVLAEDWPIHRWYMAHFANGGWSEQTSAWIDENRSLRSDILERLQKGGPLAVRDFDDGTIDEERQGHPWHSPSATKRMTELLWLEGEIMVTGRQGRTRIWDLTSRCLPEGLDLALRPERDEVVARAAELAVRALGVATLPQIRRHFTRGRYPNLKQAVARLQRDGLLQAVQVGQGDEAWPGAWFIHVDNLPLLDELRDGAWQPRTTLLSPFDNLICDRDRTELLFDFFFRIEIYVPKAKRQHGYYVLPILYGDRLVGRIDPRHDRQNGQLVVNNVYAESHAAGDEEVGAAAAAAIDDLAGFLGAQEVVYAGAVPPAWRAAMGNHV